MTTIKAPYNFVPIAEKCYFPEWANNISHDIPFSDGVSGSIDIRITAETPVFVRNDSSDGSEQTSFSQDSAGRYFIPGTSIKGEIRNVLEILSFGKMTQVQDLRFGIRNFNPGSGYSEKLRKVQCGWLRKDVESGEYRLEMCGEPYRINDKKIDESYYTHLADFCGTMSYNPIYEIDGEKCKTEDIKKEDYIKTASVKYEIFGTKIIRVHFRPEKKDEKKYSKKTCVIDSDSESAGYLVFTGQSTKREWNIEGKRGNGKQYEFVFPEVTNSKVVAVPDEIIKDFKYIHRENYDYLNLWRDDLESGECKIPVFFTMTGDSIDAIGLTFMFKYPSYHHIYSAIPKELLSLRRKDLAECIFGYISDEKSLKTRVYFKHAFLEGEAKKLDLRKEVLSSPKPSFSGTYLEKTSWNNGGIARISGRKRYPVRNRIVSGTQGNGNIETEFIPLATGSVFTERIIFHNLRPAELGALLSAITFHGRKECFHSIGMAKPLGYGKAKVEVEKLQTDSDKTLDDFLNVFASVMEKFTPGWQSSPSLEELFAMAVGIGDKDADKFKYLVMGTGNKVKKDNEYENVTNENQSLPRFTKILKGSLSERYTPSPMFTDKRERFDAEAYDREEEKELKRQYYGSIIERAKELIEPLGEADKGKLSEAEKLLDEAGRVYPQGTLHIDLKQSIENECIKRDADRRAQEAAEKEKKDAEDMRKTRIEAGLSILAETYPGDYTRYKVVTIKMLQEKVMRYIKDQKITCVPENQYGILQEQIFRILGSLNKRGLKDALEDEKKGPELLKTLKRILPEEDAVRMFEEVKKQF